MSTPFPLGVFVGNPDASNSAAQAAYDARYAEFQSIMGAPAQFNLDFIDQTLPISSWATSAKFSADSSKASSAVTGTTPVISLPMVSTAGGSPSPDQTYKNFASGMYDNVLTDMVKPWAQDGYTTQYWRLGWEMNVGGALSYAGNDSQTQSDWIAAFQHISTVLHNAGSANGSNVQVVWNPGIINASDAGVATQTLYPGSNYVDVIGADIYSDISPYGAPNNIYDWATGKTDTSLQAWASNPVNLIHYWTYPAATQYALDSSQNHSLSLQNLIDFAKSQGKPIGIAETGAGNTADGANVPDDAAFPQWLASTLSGAGVPIKFVNIYDSNGNGVYEFSSPSDNKPQEAAAWAKYFGSGGGDSASSTPAATQMPPPPPAATQTPNPTPTPTPTSGTDTLIIQVSEDAWQGDAQYTINVDGTPIDGTRTATASHAAGASQDMSVTGNWGAGAHTIGITFINDAYGGTPQSDRNLYVGSVTYDGIAATGTPASLLGSSTKNFSVPAAADQTTPASSGSTETAITLQLAEDAWQGDAQYKATIDGVQIGQNGTVTTLNSSGNIQSDTLSAALTAGTHDLAISFLNDAYGGSASTDRNLYVKGVSVNGTAIPNGTATLTGNVTDHFQLVVPA